jgi:hypothetical protein
MKFIYMYIRKWVVNWCPSFSGLAKKFINLLIRYLRIQLTHLLLLHHSQTINSLPFCPLTSFLLGFLSHCWLLSAAPASCTQKRDDWLRESTWIWWVEFSSFPAFPSTHSHPTTLKVLHNRDAFCYLWILMPYFHTCIMSYHPMFHCIYVVLWCLHICVCLWWATCAFHAYFLAYMHLAC